MTDKKISYGDRIGAIVGTAVAGVVVAACIWLIATILDNVPHIG